MDGLDVTGLQISLLLSYSKKKKKTCFLWIPCSDYLDFVLCRTMLILLMFTVLLIISMVRLSRVPT